MTDGLARDREVIVFDNAGISSSSARRGISPAGGSVANTRISDEPVALFRLEPHP